MIDRATVDVVNSTWPDGLLKLWACNFFSEDYRSSTVRSKIYRKKIAGVEERYVIQGFFEWCSLNCSEPVDCTNEGT